MPIVAVMMPGYGEVAGLTQLMLRQPEVPEPPVEAAACCGSVSQFQYSWNQELPSILA